MFQQLVKDVYLPHKVRLSLRLARSQRRQALPVLGESLEGRATVALAEAINARCGQLKYKLDPWWGLYDYYNHPEHTEYLAATGDYEQSTNDCDDYATYAQALFYQAGVSSDNAWEWNLIVPAYKQVTQGKWNHTLCGFRTAERVGVIDTNSAARRTVFWFTGNQAEIEQQVIAKFRTIYPADYRALVRGNWLARCARLLPWI